MHAAAVRRPVGALAVDRHRRRHHQLAQLGAALDDAFEQHRGAERVHRHVALDLVHRLADAHGRGLVEDRLDAVERARHGRAVAHVADQQLGAAGSRCAGRCAASARAPAGSRLSSTRTRVARGDERVHEVRADEAGAAGDEDLHAASLPTLPLHAREAGRCAPRPQGLRGHPLGRDARHAAVVDRTVAQVAGPAGDVLGEHAHALEVERRLLEAVGPISTTQGTPNATATCRAPASLQTSDARAPQHRLSAPRPSAPAQIDAPRAQRGRDAPAERALARAADQRPRARRRAPARRRPRAK